MYTSRVLNNTEQAYSTTEKELLSIVWSIKNFRPYLLGRKFQIFTDHRPLTWLFNVKYPGLRLMRWRLKLAEYKYEVNYKPGVTNKCRRVKSNRTNFVNQNHIHRTTVWVPRLSRASRKLSSRQQFSKESIRRSIRNVTRVQSSSLCLPRLKNEPKHSLDV